MWKRFIWMQLIWLIQNDLSWGFFPFREPQNKTILFYFKIKKTSFLRKIRTSEASLVSFFGEVRRMNILYVKIGSKVAEFGFCTLLGPLLVVLRKISSFSFDWFVCFLSEFVFVLLMLPMLGFHLTCPIDISSLKVTTIDQ